jgi:hypothetical protein
LRLCPPGHAPHSRPPSGTSRVTAAGKSRWVGSA